MPAHGDIPPPPSREDVEQRLLALIDGTFTREEVSNWASQWAMAAEDPGVEDSLVWEALDWLAAADLITIDRPYLYEEVDFRAWLEEFRAKARGEVPPPPSRYEVEVMLQALIGGVHTREYTASWAAQWVKADEPNVEDPVVWKALHRLAGSDVVGIDRSYLYEEADYRAWLEELRRGG